MKISVRRFWHRLFGPQLFAQPSVAQGEDRPVVLPGLDHDQRGVTLLRGMTRLSATIGIARRGRGRRDQRAA